ncbi:gluconate 2-dehydrogenase subunit 3 family protein [Segetibacter sp. 3557_3]|uniref:gluconate 2-dehydrogenase subunit 3 family protein n=1 Tax=Segetibacter sp. 3557_3 TaxID=2547429 RepID=UPI0010585CC1|nr:gluconate 2-dehydrogenase subunit 3 family protein [Segetibacter sp. 3557_3]TDH21406.1 gluconate 2-dehydrogenase subunit 3 family protein [Segetibacter sp. 3557_3]
MNRRESLKALGIGTLSAGVLIDACKPNAKADNKAGADNGIDAERQVSEIEKDKRLRSETFFTPHEMATITILGDIIIPKDDRSGGASDAKVPEFIEFIVKDIPDHQLPMRGGLRWLDVQCLNRYEKTFKDCTAQQRIEMVDQIAYPAKAKPEMQQGVAFFDRMRSLTASGFFSSKMGIEDLGYVGNRPNQWTGVPADVIKQYGLENVNFDSKV